MDQQQILNATITIEEIVDKGKKLSIKANNGSRIHTYSVWKDKADGTPTAAHAQFINMGLKAGDTVYIGYVIDEFTTNINGFDKRVQSKKIINFRESNEIPTPSSQRPESPRVGQNSASSEVIKDSSFFERLAYEKCCSLWVAPLMQRGTVAVPRFDEFWTIFQAIKADGAKRFAEAPTNSDLPVIRQEELDDIGESVPF